jgi:hypothetical protein
MSGATKSAERAQLEQALEDLSRQLVSQEKRLYREEDEYLKSSMSRSTEAQVPQFGNLVSGWEGILEGTRVDTAKGKEKIYSRACSAAALGCVCRPGRVMGAPWPCRPGRPYPRRAEADPCPAPACCALLRAHSRTPPLARYARTATPPLPGTPAESSVTWKDYQEARAAEKERKEQDAQAQAMRAAMQAAQEAGATGAEVEERGKAAAAAAAASFKLKGKSKSKGHSRHDE